MPQVEGHTPMIKRPPVHQDPMPEALRTTSIRCPQSCQPRARCLLLDEGQIKGQCTRWWSPIRSYSHFCCVKSRPPDLDSNLYKLISMFPAYINPYSISLNVNGF